jgi:hypothetical protein
MVCLTPKSDDIQIDLMGLRGMSIQKKVVGWVWVVLAIHGIGISATGESSSALTSEAWVSLEQKNYAAARQSIARCQNLYGAEAENMQKSLSALPNKENAHRYWALNDVGTCLFILGKVAEAQGLKKEAWTAYQKVVNSYGYAQCWDKGGWFWQPAVAAKERLAALKLEEEK